MWSSLDKVGGITTKVAMPTDGILSIVKPPDVELCAYVNDKEAPLHHLHVKAGDTVYFELKGAPPIPTEVKVEYDGKMHIMHVNCKTHEQHEYTQYALPKEHKKRKKEKKMKPIEELNVFANPMGGAGAGIGAGAGAGLGAGLLGGILGGLLFGRRGLGGEDGDRGHRDGERGTIWEAALVNNIQNGVNGLTASVPTTALQTQNAIQGSIGSLALGTQQGLSNVKDATQNQSAGILVATSGVKDAVQNGFALTNVNLLEGLCSVKQVVVDDGEKTRALLTSRFQLEDATKINELNARVIELQSEGRRSADNAELKLQIVNTNTAVAAQQQGQQQQQQQQILASIAQLFPILQGITQVAHATNSNVIAGNSGPVATGAQTSTPTNVNTR